MDPEHLINKEWEKITDCLLFRSNCAFSAVDEAHLINQWGHDFRDAFKHIGSFFRSRLPSSVPTLALTATLQPGPPTTSVCQSLGFRPGNFHCVRLSNERPNIQFLTQKLTHGLSGTEFPDLLPYLNSGRKTIIYCRSIDLCERVSAYLWRCLPATPERHTRVRLYHALCWDEENEETVRLLREECRTQAVVATVAFGQGMNIKTVVDVIILGKPDTVEILAQYMGRAGRDGFTISRGIVLAPADLYRDAKKFVLCESVPSLYSLHL